MNTKVTRIVVACTLLLAVDVASHEWGGGVTGSSFIGAAEARVGRPATPGSVAGVARRTTRRVVRRSAIYISTLPAGRVVAPINGINYWRCGATYYEGVGGRYVVVYVN